VSTTLTVVKELAGILRHSFGRLMPALGACNGRILDHERGAIIIAHRWLCFFDFMASR
jgi:hypothetical protein